MRDLQDMTLGQRVMVTVAIVVLIMLALALVGYISGRWEEAQAEPLPSRWESRLIELDKDALDRAYVSQVGHIFDIWIKDGVDDPSRATRGFTNARKGYNAGMVKIEQRQQMLPK